MAFLSLLCYTDNSIVEIVPSVQYMQGEVNEVRYHIDTIPVWEAMEKDSSCPLCALYQKCEETEIDRSLGGSVMEPDARIRVNERGICCKHHQQLFMMQNRLGHALLVDSHSKEHLKKLDELDKLLPSGTGKRGLFGSKKEESTVALADALEKMSTSCVICEDIDSHMQRYMYTFLHLWKTDTKFRRTWEESKGMCLPHAAALLRFAAQHLNAENQAAFSKSMLSLLKTNLGEDEQDLEWFTLKFDYRNQSKPWGNSRNALERTINRLRGFCISSDAKKE